MCDGYICIIYFDSDTIESAWTRAQANNYYCVHETLAELLSVVRRLPGQDIIGICRVRCSEHIRTVQSVPVRKISDISYLGRPFNITLFSEVIQGSVGLTLDRYLERNGWVLLQHAGGYQIFFGSGVQIDNNYEYGFPYLYDREELVAFAHDFYRTRLVHFE